MKKAMYSESISRKKMENKFEEMFKAMLTEKFFANGHKHVLSVR